MSEAPILAMVLEGDDAIRRWRDLMGPTDAKKAGKETLRGQFGTDIERNATHGSDAEETAAFEIGFFFSGLELA
jgi:nucleoside-diphosphate kinase